MKHLAFFTLVACTPGAPAVPSFQQDVLPILAANCVRCHGFPSVGGAPIAFRLDTFANTVVTDGQPGAGNCGGDPDPTAEKVICGAATYAPLIGARVGATTRPMPPRFPLEDVQIETLSRWTERPDRGEPRPDNHPPTLAIESSSQTGVVLALRVRIDDVDHDLVVGTLYAMIDTRKRVVGTVRSGVIDLTWDTTGISPGDYAMVSSLDDGVAQPEIQLGMIHVGAP